MKEAFNEAPYYYHKITLFIIFPSRSNWYNNFINCIKGGNILKERKKESITGLIFISPYILGVTVFLLIPAVLSIYYAFCDYSMIQAPVFTGLRNWGLLTEDIVFKESLKNTLYFALLYAPLLTVVSLIFAVFLNQSTQLIKGKILVCFRAIYYFPSVAPWVAIGAVWIWLLNRDTGIINWIITALGGEPIAFLSYNSGWMIPSLVLSGVWKSMGYMMFIFLIGLNNIPKSLYEASEIDGANWIQKLWNITVPLLSPTTFFVLIMSTLRSFNAFQQVYIMTFGSPQAPKVNLLLYLYEQGFQYFKMGYASTIAWVFFLITGTVTVIQTIAQKYWVYYD